MIGTILEAEDVARMLGYDPSADPSAIAAALRGQGITFKTGRDGRPFTTVEAVNYALGLSEELLQLPEVRARTGKSTSTIYAEMDAGTFPRPLKRGRQAVWVASEVQAVIAREVAAMPRMGQGMGARAPRKKKAAESAA
jgi:prophage regulatory protein